MRRFRLPPFVLGCVQCAGQRRQAGAPFAEQVAKAALTFCLAESLGPSIHAEAAAEVLDPLRRHLWPLLQRITDDPYRRWTVAEMAEACHVSPDYFTKCFHKIIGLTPRRFLLETQMRAAAAELTGEPPVAIKTVADKTQYASVHAFTRAFTRVFGISPAAYRRSAIEL